MSPETTTDGITNETTYAEVMETKAELPVLDEDELEAMYQQYLDEGHLIVGERFQADPESASWVMFCSCGASSGYTGEGDMPAPDEELRGLTFVDARWWARGHRTRHGLDLQDRIQNVTGRMLGRQYLDDGHCVAAVGPVEESSTWKAFCSCGMDSGEDPEMGTNVMQAADADVIKWWADEHRMAHGLEPQELLPHPLQVYNIVDDEEGDE